MSAPPIDNVIPFRHEPAGDFARRARFNLWVCLDYWGEGHWGSASIAAAESSIVTRTQVPTPQQWADMLDRIEAVLTPILRDYGQSGGR